MESRQLTEWQLVTTQIESVDGSRTCLQFYTDFIKEIQDSGEDRQVFLKLLDIDGEMCCAVYEYIREDEERWWEDEI